MGGGGGDPKTRNGGIAERYKLTKEEGTLSSLNSFKTKIRKKDLAMLIENEGCKNCNLGTS